MISLRNGGLQLLKHSPRGAGQRLRPPTYSLNWRSHSMLRKSLKSRASDGSDPNVMVQGMIRQLREDPVLRKILENPRMQGVLAEFQKDPQSAIQRYSGEPTVMAVLAKLTTFEMSNDHKRAFKDMGASPEDLASTIYSNQKLAIKLQQPRVRAALAEFRANPEAAQKKYEDDDEIVQVLEMLESSMSIDV